MAPIWESVAWGIRATIANKSPDVRHDGKAWRDSDSDRLAVANMPLGFLGVPLFVKGDWAEYVQSLGVATWSSYISSCPLCHTVSGDLYIATELSPLGPPGERKTLDTFEAACSSCEIKRVLDAAEVELVNDHLFFDKSDKGSHGRALLADIPTLGLRKGDRLEPTRGTPNVAVLDPAAAPISATFWRPSCETAYRHRCPLFSRETTLSPENLGVDWLHTISLGIAQAWLAYLVWDLLLANVFDLHGRAADRLELGVARMRELLFSWYTEESAAGREHTRARKFTPLTIGTNKKRKFAMYGAETNSFVAFAAVLLVRFGNKLGAKARFHRAACRSLNALIDAIRTYPKMFPAAAIQKFCNDTKEHLWAVKKLGISPKPKHHFLIEMAGRLASHGSPAYHACWADESANFQLKVMCQAAHRAVWHGRVLATWASKSGHDVTRARKKRRR